jgi:multidrug efflux pump subunit AcrA (membrane-fusion protein)
MKKKTKWIIAICVIAVVAVVVLLAGRSAIQAAQQAQTALQTRSLAKMTLADTVDVTGTVESKESENVYSMLSTLPVKNIYVAVGDTVSEGDVLCDLDTDSLQKDYDQSEASLDATQSSAQEQIDSAQTKYDNAVENLNNGMNAQVNSANAAVESAQATKSRADQAYYDALNAKNAARTTLDAAQAAYDQDPSPENEAGLATARTAYEEASQAESAASSATYDAQKAYDTAVQQQKTTVNAANQEVEAYWQALQSSKAAADSGSQEIGLEKIQMQLDEGVITAPISGTVTAVNAVEGANSSGILFVVENTKDLQIETTIKEYDINSVSPGLEATIQSDGTGDDVYEGKLSSIAPAAAADTSASSLTGTSSSGSSDVKFDAVIDVTSQDTALKIGMNARVDIILDQKEDVFAVPYDAVAQNAAGETVVYALVQDEQGQATYQEVPVFTGMETDFYIEISGKDLAEGMQIISNPDSIPALGAQIQS